MLRLATPLDGLRATLHNGPGWRISVWVQGCSLRCTTDCLNPHMLDPTGGYAVTVSDVVASLLETACDEGRPVEGITLLGGEPTEQADGAAELFERLQGEGWSTMLYSGYTLEALRRRGPAVGRLLADTDLLVDGPFLPERYREDLAWRGSDNQRIHCLTTRYSAEALDAAFREQGKGFSLDFRADGTMSASGLQRRDAAAEMERKLAAGTRSVVGKLHRFG